MATIISKNRMSATALKESENAPLEFIKNPKKDGNLFFSCGSKTGYISPRVLEMFNNKDLCIDDMQYAECSTDNGNTWVPCIMVVGDGANNVMASF